MHSYCLNRSKLGLVKKNAMPLAFEIACEPRTQADEAGEKNGARKSEPARELLIFEFPAFADERSDPIG